MSDLMDAKAKVVANLVVCPDRVLVNTRHGADDLQEGRYDLVTLTDHEAALAELRKELSAWRELSLACSMPGPIVWPNSWPQDVAIVAHLIWTLQSKNQSLLTGLEALAGEWKRKRTFEGSVADDAYSDAADALRTLTNSAKGE